MRTRLIFTGRRFRRAKPGEPYEITLRSARDWAPVSKKVVVDLTTTGVGQEWTADAPAAFWRSFAAIDPADGEAAASFCRRHGEPFDRLAPDKPASTSDWLELLDALRAAAGAWEPLGPDGVSRITRDSDRLRSARCFLRDRNLTIENDVKPEQNFNTGGFHNRAKVLFAFMIQSAGHHLENETPMRACIECLDYFEHQRSDARFCSGRCHVAYQRRSAAKNAGNA
ncbi:hypothetical protein [Bosea sp. NBC_00550]|uniref:hypothetical protein n=1 Tax=Bosea sp. NBC_00550 TaxID=2969621 RepID=UPI00222FAF65|nr:hypothetical protein [Bosea sp. NBC_00550]UZF94380.1 hypothetical protein NWE53_09455 [Bosea sp. NBC_00550]